MPNRKQRRAEKKAVKETQTEGDKTFVAETPIPERNREINEELVALGALVPAGLSSPSADKCFAVQGGNVITIDAVYNLPRSETYERYNEDHLIDMRTLLDVLYRQRGTFMLDDLLGKYLDVVDERFRCTLGDQLRDEVFQLLGPVHQLAVPVLGISEHPSTWRSRSMVARYQNPAEAFTSDDQVTNQVYLSVLVNGDLSLWDHYNGLFERGMTRQESDETTRQFQDAVAYLIRSGAVYVNVPTSMYNQ